MKKLVEVHDGMLTTNTWLIAQAVNRDHSKVKDSLKRLIKTGILGDVADFGELSVTTNNNAIQTAFSLSEKDFLIAMPFICGKKGKEGQRALVNEFLRLRREAEVQHYFIEMTDDEQASTCGRGLANRRWGKPVFDLQFCLALDNPNDPAGIESK